jgi:glycosyltransferase involved in cell wall biosynthesis
MDITFSFIIPHFNDFSRLNRLLNSIPANRCIEIIVVDDNSKENTESIAHILTRYNVKFIYNDSEKRGAGACRNIGLRNSVGEWIIFADSDDYFIDLTCHKLINFVSEEYDCIYFNPTSYDEGLNGIGSRHLTYKNIISGYFLNKNELDLRYRYVVPWSKIYKRSFLFANDILFDEVIASNDVMFSTKVGLMMRKFKVYNEIIYCVTQSKGSLTKNISRNVFRARLKVEIDRYKFLSNRISGEDFKELNLVARGFIIGSIKYGLGVKELVRTFSELQKNKVKLGLLVLLNPFVTSSKIIKHFKHYKNNKNMWVKNE